MTRPVSDPSLAEAVDRLRRGGVVAAATETFFGLLADATNPTALDSLFRCKHREASKRVALIVADTEAWLPLVRVVPPLALAFAEAFWPGPLTIALEASDGLDPRLLVEGGVGVRLPPACDARGLAAAFGAPLTATSANLAGEPPMTTGDAVAQRFAGTEVLVLPGVSPGGAPSTVIRVDGLDYRVARPGAIDADALEQVAIRVNGGSASAVGAPG